MSDDASDQPPPIGQGGSGKPPAVETQSMSSLRSRELIGVAGMVVLADLTIYRGHGFLGLAVFLVGAAALLILAKIRAYGLPASILFAMIGLLSVRAAWLGAIAHVPIGLGLLAALATVLNGHQPALLKVIVLAAQSLVAGAAVLFGSFRALPVRLPGARPSYANIFLPAATVGLFAVLFLMANPDAVSFVQRQLEQIGDALYEWFVNSARPLEVLFWLVVACLTAGLIRPLVDLAALNPSRSSESAGEESEAPRFAAIRNTLISVIGLFTIYLTYEFVALWRREFPEGFYYAGYAHQGAAWLTVALALATAILSAVFSGRLLRDPRLAQIRTLAWIWSLQNLLLSLAVYNRLFIYIQFNGLTRWRIVGLFGTTLVVVGFLLVVWKFTRRRDFHWLLRRQVWAFAVAVYLFVLTPVDAVAVSYNARRIRAGELSACMQIGVHELDLEGTLALLPLLQCESPEIRSGVAALVAQRYVDLKQEAAKRDDLGWTARQYSDAFALQRFERVREHWQEYESVALRDQAIKRLYEFAYQWY